ncbi:S1C family serine protease [Sedimentibacter sp. MB31-C6]|uniref:S1C family serine protease n=1 Tax=Sedimentibacter sp. MB31-C6 TaxID=3109366 RepID=UPI002DDD7538|nr:trypsin-like peptidase domain-containing protein [Sedimentibacter sp. MB36-C1]WSI05427.1 trypsin-like peptidase domain-containing protein [Sedimentibacter sp. MB36-C1]
MDNYERNNNLNENCDFTNLDSKGNDINFIMPNFNEPEKKKKSRNKKKSFFSFIAIAIVSALLGGLAGGYIVATQFNIAYEQNNDNITATAQDVNINLSDDVYFAAAVAEKSQKTVVGITSEVVEQYNTFFGPQTQRGQSMGSGFIVDSDGYIVTNSHVIGDGNVENIAVSLIDGTTEIGEVLWYDTTLDLAIVKINRTGLPTVELGDSDELMIGEPAVAIGNPMTLDLERTVTQGIISGLNRSIAFDDGTVIEPLIQTDASINSGNSGGPLFNAEGKVIGINTAKINTAEGLGFSIPINIAKPIIEQFINEGTFSTVYVGITGVDVETYEMALGIDVSADYGVVIIETIKNSPATESGLKPGDIIVAIDGDKLDNMSSLKRQLYEYKNDDKVELTIIRNGEEQKVEMTLKVKPTDF